MMDSAYFIGRSEILSWINSTLHLNLSKVEEAFTGAVPCQLMDAAHPGMVPMHKVNFDAKNDEELAEVSQTVIEPSLPIIPTSGCEEFNFQEENVQAGTGSPPMPATFTEPMGVDYPNNIDQPSSDPPIVQPASDDTESINADSINTTGHYNALERREACKGGREANKKSAAPQPSAKTAATSTKHAPHNGRRNASGEGERLLLCKAEDIEIVCQCPEIENLPVVEAIKRILYATDTDGSFVVEAQAMISQQQQVEPADDNIPEEEQDNKQKVENQKRKIIINSDVDVAASITLSPRQKIADASDVHCSGPPLVTY
nr:microtubule-associated protein RP/EB family member 1C [Ipomoea batatas]